MDKSRLSSIKIMSSLDMSSLVSSIYDLPSDVGFTTFLLHLFNKRKYTDVDFCLTNEDDESELTFSAHRFVLALRSSYFADEFYNPRKESQNLIELADVNAKGFENMLKFMYDNMPKIEIPKEIWDTYKVAKKFNVISLMTECCKTLNALEIVPSNVLNVLELADDMQFMNTKEKCVYLIVHKIKEVKESYNLSNISPAMMHILIESLNLSSLLQLEMLSFFRLELLLWIFAWGKNRFVEIHLFNSTRSALEEFLPKLPFLMLSNVQFAQLNEMYENVLEPSEVISIFMNIAVPNSKRMPSWYMSEAN